MPTAAEYRQQRLSGQITPAQYGQYLATGNLPAPTVAPVILRNIGLPPVEPVAGQGLAGLFSGPAAPLLLLGGLYILSRRR